MIFNSMHLLIIFSVCVCVCILSVQCKDLDDTP